MFEMNEVSLCPCCKSDKWEKILNINDANINQLKELDKLKYNGFFALTLKLKEMV